MSIQTAIDDHDASLTPATYLQQLAEAKGVALADVAKVAGMAWGDLTTLSSDSGVYGTMTITPIYRALRMSFAERYTFDQLTYDHWPRRVLPYKQTPPDEVSMGQARGHLLYTMIQHRGIGMDKIQEVLGLEDEDPLAKKGRLALGKLQGIDGGLSEHDVQIVFNYIHATEPVEPDERDSLLEEQEHIATMWRQHALNAKTIPEFMRAKFEQRGISQQTIAQRLKKESDQMSHAMGGKKPFPISWVQDFDHILYFEPDEWQCLLDLYEQNHGYASAFNLNLDYAECHQGQTLRADMPLPDEPLSTRAISKIHALGWEHLLGEGVDKPEAKPKLPPKPKPKPAKKTPKPVIDKPVRPVGRVQVDSDLGLLETLQACRVSLTDLGENISPRAMSEGLDRGFHPSVLREVLERELTQPPEVVEAVLAANQRHADACSKGSGKAGGS